MRRAKTGYGASQSQSEASYLEGELKNITTMVMPIYATSRIADSLVWRQRCLTPSAQFWLQFWLCNGTRRVVCNTTHDLSTTSDSNDNFQLAETVTCRYASPNSHFKIQYFFDLLCQFGCNGDMLICVTKLSKSLTSD